MPRRKRVLKFKLACLGDSRRAKRASLVPNMRTNPGQQKAPRGALSSQACQDTCVFRVYFAGAPSRALEESERMACFSASVSIVLIVSERFASASFTLAVSLCLRSSLAIQSFE